MKYNLRNLSYPWYCCQKCGENIGWIGRFLFFGLLHSCPSKFVKKEADCLNERKEEDKMLSEEYDVQKGFLYAKLNSDMSPAAADKFIPLVVKELNELNKQYPQHKGGGYQC